jgi:hypothetical protein
LVAQNAHQTEEEISFRQSPRQLLLYWKVFYQKFILHRILIQILYGDLLVAWQIHMVDFIFPYNTRGNRGILNQ